MTSIAVSYNKLGIAIAADSAATANVGGDSHIKIFDANKIFKVSDTIGIGIYQNSNLGNIPLEVTINEFKKNCNIFNELEDSVYSFIEYLEKASFIENKDINQELLLYSTQISRELNEYLMKETVNEKSPITEEIVKKYAENFFKRPLFHKNGESYNLHIIENWDKEKNKMIESSIITKDDLKNLLIKNNEKILLEFIDDLFVGFNNRTNNDFTGFIFVGYGSHDILPKIFHVKIKGKYNGKIYFYFIEEDNKKNDIDCGIFGYADAEVIISTVCGYSPQFANMVLNVSESLLGEIGRKVKREHKIDIGDDINQSKNKLISAVEGFRLNEVQSFIRAISVLSLDELAEVVEMLINVTSFKKRISTKLETVGGETDVAVISRFDGFKRIKRKNYYKRELNLD